jgi:hypothetical protein
MGTNLPSAPTQPWRVPRSAVLLGGSIDDMNARHLHFVVILELSEVQMSTAEQRQREEELVVLGGLLSISRPTVSSPGRQIPKDLSSQDKSGTAGIIRASHAS